MKIFKESSIREIVQEPEALISAALAFRALAQNQVVQPFPFHLGVQNGEVHVKGAYIAKSPIFAIKVASGFPSNQEQGLPVGSGLVLVFDGPTGFPKALFKDNGYLTDLRTAAAAALAVQHLAPKSVGKMAIIGTGVQARYQAKAIWQVRRWRQASVWGRNTQHLKAYCDEMEGFLSAPIAPA